MILKSLLSDNSGRPQPEPLGTRLWSCLFVTAIFAAVCLLSSPIPGVNEPHYLAKARAFDNPTWCSRDFFLTSSNAHYVFFWLIGILTRWLSFDAIAVIGRLLSSVLLAVGWTSLGRSLGLTAIYRCMAAGGFATLSLLGSFSGEWLLGGFESKVPAWGFGLIAVSLWIRGQLKICPGWMTAAGVLCGTSCSLHPVVGGWIAVCICLASVWSLLTSSNRNTQPMKRLIGLAAFAITTIVLSLPGLIPALRMVLDTSTPQKDRELALFYQVFWRLKHHLDPTELTTSQWTYTAVLLVSLALVVKWQRTIQPARIEAVDNGQADFSAPSQGQTALGYFLTFFNMSVLIALAGVVIGWHNVEAKQMDDWQWRASLLKFYPFRCFDALLPIITAIFAGRILQDYHFCRIRVPRPLTRLLFLLLMTTLPLIQAFRIRESAPPGYSAAQFSDWQEACQWIQANTPADALILTPRESFAFKWFAERAEFVCYKDCPQDAAGILTWNKRLWFLHDWTLKSSSDLLYDNGDLEVLRQKTGCDYIVTRILGPFQAEPLWEGQHWRIYRVP